MRVTPENLNGNILPKNGIFVFGSNESGFHGAGAARTAVDCFGAEMHKGFGPQGNSFAIPTKDWQVQTLPLNIIKYYVDSFIRFSSQYKDFDFYVTKIGCGLAGYNVEDIAPLFSGCINMENIYLPIEFINIIQDNPVELYDIMDKDYIK